MLEGNTSNQPHSWELPINTRDFNSFYSSPKRCVDFFGAQMCGVGV